MKRPLDKSSEAQQPIEVLQQRYQALDKRKIQAETHLENARRELERLQREAREKYGNG